MWSCAVIFPEPNSPPRGWGEPKRLRKKTNPEIPQSPKVYKISWQGSRCQKAKTLWLAGLPSSHTGSLRVTALRSCHQCWCGVLVVTALELFMFLYEILVNSPVHQPSLGRNLFGLFSTLSVHISRRKSHDRSTLTSTEVCLQHCGCAPIHCVHIHSRKQQAGSSPASKTKASPPF